MVRGNFWSGKRVFLTGHTGFKGGWLALWLKELGASVYGYALPPPTTPSLFEIARISEVLHSATGDIRDPEALETAACAANPDIIFHLAAQPLVSEGYSDPVGTYASNVTGTLNLLQAARKLNNVHAIVVVTTDKCYENRESSHAYREGDPLGGYDPYSSSKACAEILTHSWRRSFFSGPSMPNIATARAGNVIGGGDWADNRLVPDILRAFSARSPALLRHPEAIRPWQHVLEPLAGYLLLAEQLSSDANLAGAWNFGPELEDCVAASAVADSLVSLWPEPVSWQGTTSGIPHEAGLLRLDASLAKEKLQWHPKWPLKEALRQTVNWQLAWRRNEDMQAVCLDQIRSYCKQTNEK